MGTGTCTLMHVNINVLRSYLTVNKNKKIGTWFKNVQHLNFCNI